MLSLPKGQMYMNSIATKNSIMITDINSYDDFIHECEYVFNNYKNVNKIIYKDNDRYFEITKEEWERIE